MNVIPSALSSRKLIFLAIEESMIKCINNNSELYINYDGLNESCPHRLQYLHALSFIDELFGKHWKVCAFVGRSVACRSLEVGFEI